MSQPLVSVVIPVYNGAAFLQECIDSVLCQTYHNWELVVVDNASSDRTAQIIAEFARTEPRIRAFRNPETVGALPNHNIAVRKVSGDSRYLKILHADDKLLADCLTRMVAVAERYQSAGMIGAYAHCEGRTVCQGLPEGQEFFRGGDVSRRTLLGEAYPFWSPSCLMHRTGAVLERDKFYHESNLHADLQATYEILARWDFAFVHEPLTEIGSHGASRTSRLASPMKKLVASNLELLATYGPQFLSEQEMAVRLAYRIDRYYGMLGRSLLEWRGPSFWRFHKHSLAKAGHRLSVGRLLRVAGRELVSSPRASLRKLTGSLLSRNHAQA